MNFFGMSDNWSKILALTAAVGLLGLSHAYAGGKREKIEFSDPGAPLTESNLTEKINPSLNRLNPPPSGLKQMEDDLFRPLKSAIEPVDSMQGVMSVPPAGPQQPIQRPPLSKHAKQLLEQRRNWAFTDLNDLYPDQTPEEALGIKDYGADDKDTRPGSLVDRYYERDGQKASPTTARKPSEINFNGATSESFTGANNYVAMPELYPGATEVKKSLKALVPGSGDSSDTSVVNFKTPDPMAANSDELAAGKKRLEEFGRLLNSTASEPAHESPNAVEAFKFTYGTRTTTATLLGLDPTQPLQSAATAAPAQAHQIAVNPATGLVDINYAATHPSILNDPTATALGTVPYTANNQAPPLPSKTAESVRKMLDPFAGNMPKSKF